MIELRPNTSRGNYTKIVDDDGNSTSIREGNVSKLHVQNNNTERLLEDILKELKKMNLHMSLMTDTAITNSEVE